MWRWLAARTRRRLFGSLFARNPRRCSSQETSTRCAPTETATRPPPSPLMGQPAGVTSTRSLYEGAQVVWSPAPTFSCCCLLCCCCCSGYNEQNRTFWNNNYIYIYTVYTCTCIYVYIYIYTFTFALSEKLFHADHLSHKAKQMLYAPTCRLSSCPVSLILSSRSWFMVVDGSKQLSSG